jgi:hypothetical protein
MTNRMIRRIVPAPIPMYIAVLSFAVVGPTVPAAGEAQSPDR